MMPTFKCAVGLECKPERLVYVINMFDACLYVTVGGIFALYYLDLPSATIREVFDEFPLCVEGVSDRPDEVRFVVFSLVL